METILKIENIEKYYGNKSNITKAIDNISFSVEKGEYVAIMGASGSGKTTLLNCISTIDRVSSGHIYVGRDDITKLRGNQLNRFRREELGFIFQDFNLLDTLTAYENIALALSIQNTPAKKIDEKKTLKYAVAFYFCTSGKINFMLGNKMYQHINTVYDQREDGRGFNTCEVVYNYKAQKYEVLNVDTEIGNKEITIL